VQRLQKSDVSRLINHGLDRLKDIRPSYGQFSIESRFEACLPTSAEPALFTEREHWFAVYRGISGSRFGVAADEGTTDIPGLCGSKAQKIGIGNERSRHVSKEGAHGLNKCTPHDSLTPPGRIVLGFG
jgi:hypothetical protein